MTVDEFIEWLYSPLPRQRGRAEIRTQLHALVRTEIERIAAWLEDEADKFKKSKLLEESSLLRTCAERLLATSPGKGGE